ncbi:hypothetical protein AOQ84DRAFT_416532 [Glonium stellatum]|uniref:Uncharacterized protein n=1 Tax=Glonium stellatum TaxID=574774 RepID=A0A8E2JP18_9PEZI|nr:hypothetical protein AOQ84DRAFT_416532 [Glonium stellatum]
MSRRISIMKSESRVACWRCWLWRTGVCCCTGVWGDALRILKGVVGLVVAATVAFVVLVLGLQDITSFGFWYLKCTKRWAMHSWINRLIHRYLTDSPAPHLCPPAYATTQAEPVVEEMQGKPNLALWLKSSRADYALPPRCSVI